MAAGPGLGEAEPRPWRERAITALFVAPAAFFLAVWVIYPMITTVIRSFFDRSGDRFVGLENYEALFTTDTLVTAIKNNAIWVGVVPALVTAASGTEQLRPPDGDVADLRLGAGLVALLSGGLGDLPRAARGQHNGGQEQHAHRGR